MGRVMIKIRQFIRNNFFKTLIQKFKIAKFHKEINLQMININSNKVANSV